MSTHETQAQENTTQSIANAHSQRHANGSPTLQFADNRPEAVVQRKLQAIANNSPQAQKAAQLQAMADSFSRSQLSLIQKKSNQTGLPDKLKSGVENLSGYSMDDVKVHYNSQKPAQLNAHAYAQGTDIHLASGQEKHLPHEAWHVVQQKQGRVKPTMQMKGKIQVNDDAGLEREADVMGKKALQTKSKNTPIPPSISENSPTILQRALALDNSATGSDRFVVNGNRGWKSGLEAAMPVTQGKARCHVISFEAIRLGVWQATEELLYSGGTVSSFQSQIMALINAIFPHGATSGHHKSLQLKNLAQKLHDDAITAAKNVIANKSNETNAITWANELVLCLNSSPDNLRVADASTNSSIGAALDPRGDDIQPKKHKGQQIYLIKGDTALQLANLPIAQRRELIEVYMDSKGIQTSEEKNMLAGDMDGGSRKIYIDNPITNKVELLH